MKSFTSKLPHIHLHILLPVTVQMKGKVQQWDASSGVLLHTLHLCADPTGLRVYGGILVVSYEDEPIRHEIWDMPSGRQVRKFTGHEGRLEG